MPFKSEKQRRFLWAEHPDIAKRWAHEYPNQKKLPMYAHKEKAEKSDNASEKAKEASIDISRIVNKYVSYKDTSRISLANTTMSKTDKTADSKQEIVDIPHSSKPVYAGEERDKGQISSEIPDGKNIGESCAEKPKNAINDLLTKLSVVLSPRIEQTIENMRAEREGRVARRIPRNRNVKQYPCGSINIMPPMGMAQAPAPQQQNQAQNNQYPPRPVGGGSNPQFNPINSFGALSMSGVINGNAAFGAKNSPDSSKIAEIVKRASRSDALANLMSISVTDPDDIAYLDEEFDEEIGGQRKVANVAAKVGLATLMKLIRGGSGAALAKSLPMIRMNVGGQRMGLERFLAHYTTALRTGEKLMAAGQPVPKAISEIMRLGNRIQSGASTSVSKLPPQIQAVLRNAIVSARTGGKSMTQWPSYSAHMTELAGATPQYWNKLFKTVPKSRVLVGAPPPPLPAGRDVFQGYSGSWARRVAEQTPGVSPPPLPAAAANAAVKPKPSLWQRLFGADNATPGVHKNRWAGYLDESGELADIEALRAAQGANQSANWFLNK